MRNLLLFIRRFYPFFLFLFLEVIAIVLISRSNAYQGARLVNTANQVTGSFYELQYNVTEYFSLRETNDLLAEENARLLHTLERYQRSVEVSDTMEFIDSVLYNFIPATVINHTTQKKLNYFTLDKGSRHQLAPGMGVVFPGTGLAGIITDVSPGYAVGMSMLNSRIRISVRHEDPQRNYIGILRWKGSELTTFTIEDITRTARIDSGDVFLTSGYSTFFPPGRPVAVVSSVEERDGSDFLEIDAKLTNDILSLERVYVVMRTDRREIDSLENIVE